ncbi:hypothetical protein PVAG01_09639 [Phlyctema vagabunda]|uniref:Uncharacterized protein n=1 Tax=Phlyctema vagabunda TaxID=108571 RepID=A0ABR4P7X3_9HELO
MTLKTRLMGALPRPLSLSRSNHNTSTNSSSTSSSTSSVTPSSPLSLKLSRTTSRLSLLLKSPSRARFGRSKNHDNAHAVTSPNGTTTFTSTTSLGHSQKYWEDKIKYKGPVDKQCKETLECWSFDGKGNGSQSNMRRESLGGVSPYSSRRGSTV